MTNSKGHVYLIDDDMSIRASLTRTLVDVGYAVQDFSGAKDFMENLMPVSPAVILLDMQMPDLIGLDLLEQLTQLGLKTPVIFISGQSHKKQIVQGLKNGAIDFLFYQNSLKSTVNNYINSKFIINTWHGPPNNRLIAFIKNIVNPYKCSATSFFIVEIMIYG